MDITKLKDDGEKVEVRWRREAFGTEEPTVIESKMVSRDRPAQELIDALQAFRDRALDMAGLPKDPDWREGVQVTGVSVSYEEDGRRGLVVTMQRPSAYTNAPLVLNMPHAREELIGDDQEIAGALPGEMSRMIDRLAKAAQAYVQGHRAQGDMLAGAA